MRTTISTTPEVVDHVKKLQIALEWLEGRRFTISETVECALDLLDARLTELGATSPTSRSE